MSNKILQQFKTDRITVKELHGILEQILQTYGDSHVYFGNSTLGGLHLDEIEVGIYDGICEVWMETNP